MPGGCTRRGPRQSSSSSKPPATRRTSPGSPRRSCAPPIVSCATDPRAACGRRSGAVIAAMPAFRSLVVVLALSASFAACDKEGGTAKCPERTSTPAAGGGAALDAELVKTASAGAIKMKIRTDAGGAVVKQSVYHRDQAAIPKPVHDL